MPTTAWSRSCGARRTGEVIVFVVNATPVVRYGYRIGVPHAGFYREIINTDAETYGGSNVGNLGGLQAADFPWQGRDAFALMIELPPLATVAFKLGSGATAERERLASRWHVPIRA